jgi:charged multivesicular body protein 4A/B
MALKRKKVYEEQVSRIMGSRMTLETQVMAIENANVNLETMNAMRAGAEAMKHIHGNLWVLMHLVFRCSPKYRWLVFRDINRVDSTMDDIREQMDLANEISDAISQPVGFGVEFDEDELNEELELLEQEDLDSKLLDTSGAQTIINNAPSVPSIVPGEEEGSLLPDGIAFATPRFLGSWRLFLTFLAIAQPPRPTRLQAEDEEDAELAELKASMVLWLDLRLDLERICLTTPWTSSAYNTGSSCPPPSHVASSSDPWQTASSDPWQTASSDPWQIASSDP